MQQMEKDPGYPDEYGDERRLDYNLFFPLQQFYFFADLYRHLNQPVNNWMTGHKLFVTSYLPTI